MKQKPDLSGILLATLWPLGMLATSTIAAAMMPGAAQPLLLVALVTPLPFLMMRAHHQRVYWMDLLSPLSNWLMVSLFAVWLLGSVVSPVRTTALLYTIVTLAAFLVASLQVRLISPSDLRQGLALFGTAGAALLAAVFALGPVAGRGVEGLGLNPNAIGFFAMTCASFALGWKSSLLRYGTIASVIYPLIVVNSRSSMLGLAVVLVVYAVVGCSGFQVFRRLMAILLISVVVGGLWYEPISRNVSELFALDDPNRGLQTGFTGRYERWEMALELFRKYPLLGVGFRCHQVATQQAVDAHNGYLACLAETGVIGTAVTFFLLIAALYISFRNAHRHLDAVLLAASAGYLVHSLFERFIFNVGNPGSLLFILWVVYAIGSRRLPAMAHVAHPAGDHA